MLHAHRATARLLADQEQEGPPALAHAAEVSSKTTPPCPCYGVRSELLSPNCLTQDALSRLPFSVNPASRVAMGIARYFRLNFSQAQDRVVKLIA